MYEYLLHDFMFRAAARRAEARPNALERRLFLRIRSKDAVRLLQDDQTGPGRQVELLMSRPRSGWVAVDLPVSVHSWHFHMMILRAGDAGIDAAGWSEGPDSDWDYVLQPLPDAAFPGHLMGYCRDGRSLVISAPDSRVFYDNAIPLMNEGNAVAQLKALGVPESLIAPARLDGPAIQVLLHNPQQNDHPFLRPYRLDFRLAWQNQHPA